MPQRKRRILSQFLASRETKPGRFWATLGLGGVSLFGMVAAFGVAPSTQELQISQQTVIEQLALPATFQTEETPGHFLREERIQRGDTVASLIARLGVQDEEAFDYMRQSRETQAIFRQLRPGKVVTAKTGENGELLSLTFPLNGSADNVLVIERREGQLQAAEQSLNLTAQVFMKSGEIRSSLFAATDAAGLPDAIAIQMAEIFGGDIDFHQDLRRGDRFSVVYEMLFHQGQPVRTGRILAAEFTNQDKTYQAIWYQDKNGQGGYYTAEGKSIKKAFLRSPLEFSRISSGFTRARFHPILQTWRAHKGVDYAAPTGTRVKVTGDGVIEFAGRQGGYGNVVVVRHQGKYTTHYAHLSGFAPGIRRGVRVSQGDVIGYVGATGWATGPHLHYEFRINDVHQNPLSVALPTAVPLSTQQLALFHQHAEPLIARLQQIRDVNLALLD